MVVEMVVEGKYLMTACLPSKHVTIYKRVLNGITLIKLFLPLALFTLLLKFKKKKKL